MKRVKCSSQLSASLASKIPTITSIRGPKYEQFKSTYWKAVTRGAVPFSLTQLPIEADKEGNTLHVVTVFKEQVEPFINEMRKSGFVCRKFEFDRHKYKQDRARA